MLAGRIHEASLFDRALNSNEVRRLFEGAQFIDDPVFGQHLSPKQVDDRNELRSEINRLRSLDTSVSREFAYAVASTQPKQPTRLLIRGNPATPSDVVLPGGIASVQGVTSDFELQADAAESQRRLKLAQWMTSPKNPLFARVIVNRVWQHHFGAGFVNMPSDFGFTGGRPSHPELMDFLASRLIESGWSLKTLHKLIVTSATWQQAVVDETRPARLILRTVFCGDRTEREWMRKRFEIRFCWSLVN